MAKTKEYTEKLGDLEAGLRHLESMKPKKYGDYDRIRHALDIQEARIDFFKRGYSLRDREVKEQKKLSNKNVVFKKNSNLHIQKKLKIGVKK